MTTNLEPPPRDDPHFVLRFMNDEAVEAELDFDDFQMLFCPNEQRLLIGLSGNDVKALQGLPSLRGRTTETAGHEIDTLRARIAELEALTDDLQAKIADLHKPYWPKSIQEHVAELEAENARLRGQWVHGALVEWTNRALEAEAELKRLRTPAPDVRSFAELRVMDIVQRRLRMFAAGARSGGLEARAKAADDIAEAFKSDSEIGDDAIAALIAERDSWNAAEARIAELEQQLEAASATLEDEEASGLESAGLIVRWRQRIAELEAEVARLTADLDLNIGMHGVTVKQYDELRAENARLREQNDVLREQLSAALHQISDPIEPLGAPAPDVRSFAERVYQIARGWPHDDRVTEIAALIAERDAQREKEKG